MKKPTVLFDLDGTITNSQTGIINALQYMIEQLNLKALSQETLQSFIGPPLNESIMATFGLDKKQTQNAIKVFQTYYAKKGLYENELYPEIKDALHQLQTQGYQLAIATSKPEHFAKEIIAYFNLTTYFPNVYGASLDEETRVKKADVITYAMTSLAISNHDKVAMVGDRQNDIEGARLNQIPAIGVTYGFGSFDELQAAGAKKIIQTPSELLMATQAIL